MLFLAIGILAVLSMSFSTAVEAWETRSWPQESFGGLVLAFCILAASVYFLH